jgi:hypothetical protein
VADEQIEDQEQEQNPADANPAAVAIAPIP